MVDGLEIDREQEELRIRMDESREALAQKIEQLEEKVTETVESATASVAEATATVMETVQTATASVTDTVDSVTNAVQGTVDTVRQSVEGTVDSVKEAFDLSRQVQRNPWIAFGGAVAVGYIAERLLERSPSVSAATRSRTHADGISSRISPPINGQNRETSLPTSAPAPSADFRMNGGASNGATTNGETINDASAEPSKNWIGQLSESFAPEFAKMQGLALGVLLGSAKEIIVKAVPVPVRQPLGEIIDQFTEKLGGQKIKGSMFSVDGECNSETAPSHQRPFAY